MFSFTAQHILVMRLITQFDINSPKLLHNFLYLASAESLEYHDIGFYDFTRTKNGAYSRILQSVIEDLVVGQLVRTQPFSLSTKGMDTYCALASALRPFEDYIDRCFTIYMRYRDNLTIINSALKYHLRYRKVKLGKNLFDSINVYGKI